jgi:hypothetical protein
MRSPYGPGEKTLPAPYAHPRKDGRVVVGHAGRRSTDRAPSPVSLRQSRWDNASSSLHPDRHLSGLTAVTVWFSRSTIARICRSRVNGPTAFLREGIHHVPMCDHRVFSLVVVRISPS